MLLAVISFSTFHLKSPYEGWACIFWKPDEIILFYWPFWTIGCWTTPYWTACFSETCYCEACSLRFLLFSAPNFYGKVRTLDPEISSQFFRSYSKCTDTKQILDRQALWKRNCFWVRLFSSSHVRTGDSSFESANSTSVPSRLHEIACLFKPVKLSPKLTFCSTSLQLDGFDWHNQPSVHCSRQCRK